MIIVSLLFHTLYREMDHVYENIDVIPPKRVAPTSNVSIPVVFILATKSFV